MSLMISLRKQQQSIHYFRPRIDDLYVISISLDTAAVLPVVRPKIKRKGTYLWRARERESIMGSGGCAHSGVQGHNLWSGGFCPPAAEVIL